MMPWRGTPLTRTVIDVFNHLQGKAREKALASRAYDHLPKPPAAPAAPEPPTTREPGDDQPPDDISTGEFV